jgi:hypothetical protein
MRIPKLTFLAIEWGSDRGKKNLIPKSDSFMRLAGDPADGIAGGRMAHSIRSLGSAALNISMVAQGGLDECTVLYDDNYVDSRQGHGMFV